MTAKRRSVRAQPLLAVRDVHASTRWYEQLLGVERFGDSDHDDVYQQLFDGDELVLQLHCWDDEDHPNITDPDKAPAGHGVLVWFQVDGFDAAVKRAAALRAEVVVAPHVNPNSGLSEIWIRDLDGYYVVLASLAAE